MKNELMPFIYDGNQVRTVVIEGQPWFVAKDICEILDHSNSRMAVERLDDDEKGVSIVDTLGGPQEMATVNEPGLYSLILGSRKPEAKSFKRWVTHEVIPAIRKTGSYAIQSATPAQLSLQIAQCLVDQEKKIYALETAQAIQAEIIQNIKATMLPIDKEWRKYINDRLAKIAQAKGNDFQGVKRDSYVLLEQRASCTLARRVKNLKDRLTEGGATKTAIARACRLDVIEQDKRLKEIYTAIVKELVIKYVA